MKSGTFELRLNLWAASFMLAFCVSFGPVRAVDVGPAMRQLIETDWMEQDGELSGSGEFPLERTSKLIVKGYRLAERLRLLAASGSQLEPWVSKLHRIEANLRSAESAGGMSTEQRRSIYLDVRWAIRRIALSNPLLDFDQLLFIKRHHPRGVFHMCDQYYGFNAVAGGGVYVLSEPFGPNPKVTDLLADAVVENGRLKGRRLEPGGFLSPELSYDGTTILFAYTEGKGKDLEWTPESCYHLFEVNSDPAWFS
jgi:hypothetical protein